MKIFSKLDFRLPGLLCLSLIGLNFTVQAELPPFVYDEMKRNASDVVVVRILEVAKAKAVVRGKRQQITYEAKVLRVIRTKSRLQSGGAIVIQSHYYMFGPGEVGPSNPRRLKKNDVVQAYLSKGQKADEFQIAAGGHSFEQPKPQREGGGVIDAPANPVRVEVAPAPPPAIRVEPVRPRPDFPAPDPKLGQYHRQPAVRPRPDFPPTDPDDEPAIIGGPVMPDGGMLMPMMNEIPGRFEIIPVQLTQAGKPVPVVIKLDTQTGEVWQLKLTQTQFLHNGKPQVRSNLSFEPISEGQPPRPDHGHVAPGRPAIGRGGETDPDEGEIEVIPERPRRPRPRPIPVQPPRRDSEGRSRESTSSGDATVTVVRQRDAAAEDRTPALKANSSKVTGTVVTAGSVKDYAGLTLELRLYEYHPFIADKPADLVAKLNLKNYAHMAGKETKTQFTVGEDGKIKPGMSYYITCFVIDAKDKRYLMGEKDAKRGLCKVLTGGNPNKVNLILRDLRK